MPRFIAKLPRNLETQEKNFDIQFMYVVVLDRRRQRPFLQQLINATLQTKSLHVCEHVQSCVYTAF